MRLKDILIERGISGTELARRMGVSSAYVNTALSGKVNLSVKQCQRIADILDVPLAALFDGYVKYGYVNCPHCGKPIKLVKD